MKNKAIDLHNILFEQLERLSDTDVKGKELVEEIQRAEAMNKVAGQIISNGNMVLRAMETAKKIGTKDLPDMLNGKAKPLQIPEPTTGK